MTTTPPPTSIPHNNNGVMEMMKAQMMTMTMMNAANNHGGNSNNQSYVGMIYVFLATAIIDFIFNSILPTIREVAKKYYKEGIKNTKLIGDIIHSTSSQVEKTASITVFLNISDHENVLGQALLDFITNNEKTKHISFKKQNFVLNQSDVIEISEELFVKLKSQKMADEAVAESSTDKEANIEQIVELFSNTKTMQDLRSFLNKITHEYKIKIENKLGDKYYYFNQHPVNAPIMQDGEKDYSKLPNNAIFTMKEFQTNRKFSNLFGPEIDSVRKRVDFFIKNRKWYDSKGIPYTLGLLLSGLPGTGKTSTIKCLANETKRHIININLHNDITKSQLENLFFNELIVVLNISSGVTEKYYIPLDKRIYVLEDIDCQSDLVMERTLKNGTVKTDAVEKKKVKETVDNNDFSSKNVNVLKWNQAEKLDLSFLLNILDGVLENPGRIVIMTSNYPEMLDRALIRPGRIDVSADFQRCNAETLIRMVEFFYDIDLDETEKAFIQGLNPKIVSPAEMGKIMFENFDDYHVTLNKLKDISMAYVEPAVIAATTSDEEIAAEEVSQQQDSIVVEEKMDESIEKNMFQGSWNTNFEINQQPLQSYNDNSFSGFSGYN
jgi:DNA polymerase III delta prime subunit